MRELINKYYKEKFNKNTAVFQLVLSWFYSKLRHSNLRQYTEQQHKLFYSKAIIHNVFQTRKSCARLAPIVWQASAPACQEIADRLPRDFRVWKNTVDDHLNGMY